MEVDSTSNLVSSEADKTTIACNFQTMSINSFVMPNNLVRGQIGSCMDICKYKSIRSFMMANLYKISQRNTSKQQNQNQPVAKTNLFTFQNALRFAKKQQTSLVKTW